MPRNTNIRFKIDLILDLIAAWFAEVEVSFFAWFNEKKTNKKCCTCIWLFYKFHETFVSNLPRNVRLIKLFNQGINCSFLKQSTSLYMYWWTFESYTGMLSGGWYRYTYWRSLNMYFIVTYNDSLHTCLKYHRLRLQTVKIWMFVEISNLNTCH